MKNYHDLHLKCDDLLLAEVFEKLQNNSLKNCNFELISNACNDKI